MLISHKGKLIFIHIPKTGGTSYRSVIMKKDPKAHELEYFHAPMTQKIANMYPNYRKFGIVRNSWELCASGYRFESRRDPIKREKTFKQWLIDKYNSKIQNDWPFPKQHLYLQYGCEVRYYDKLKIQGKAHYYGGYDFKTFYQNQESIDIVYEMCAKDIALYNFQFNG